MEGPRTINRTIIEGDIVVSTIEEPNGACETAIIDRGIVHVVETYSSFAEACKGHDRWVVTAKPGVTIYPMRWWDEEDGSVSRKRKTIVVLGEKKK
jgi:hypothetical protein